MKVFLAGSTGAIGRALLHKLVASGHEVIAMTRSSGKAPLIRGIGAEPVVCDVFDAARLRTLMAQYRPDVVLHELTDLPSAFDLNKLKQHYPRNNRIRIQGTKILLDAAHAAKVKRFVVQSMATWYSPDEGNGLRTEEDPLYYHALPPVGHAVQVLAEMEKMVLGSGLDPVVLRYGGFYGPGTWYGSGGGAWKAVLARRYPMIDGGHGVMSWIHVGDAASATISAMHASSSGVFNVVDDEPSPTHEWLPFYANAIGAKRPYSVPLWLARFSGRGFVEWQHRMPGASNAKIKREIGWEPHYRSWRAGFQEGLSR